MDYNHIILLRSLLSQHCQRIFNLGATSILSKRYDIHSSGRGSDSGSSNRYESTPPASFTSSPEKMMELAEGLIESEITSLKSDR